VTGLHGPLGCALSCLRWRQAALALALLALRCGLRHASVLVLVLGLALASKLAGALWCVMTRCGTLA